MDGVDKMDFGMQSKVGQIAQDNVEPNEEVPFHEKSKIRSMLISFTERSSKRVKNTQVYIRYIPDVLTKDSPRKILKAWAENLCNSRRADSDEAHGTGGPSRKRWEAIEPKSSDYWFQVGRSGSKLFIFRRSVPSYPRTYFPLS